MTFTKYARNTRTKSSLKLDKDMFQLSQALKEFFLNFQNFDFS